MNVPPSAHGRIAAAFLVALVVGTLAGCGPAAPRGTSSGTLTVPQATPAPPSAAPIASATPSAPGSAIRPGNPIRIPLSGVAPASIAIDGTTAWVLGGESGTLMEVDLATGSEVRAIDVGFGATHLALQPGGMAAVGRFADTGIGSYLVVVDLASGDVRGIETGELGALAGGEGSVVWALEKADRLVKVDTEAGSLLDDVTLDVGENVHVEVQWGAGSAWVGSDGLHVVRVDGDDLANRTTIEVPSGIPFRFEAGLIWGAGPTELWAIDPNTNALDREIPLHDVMEILALDIDGDDAWLAVRRPGYIGRVIRLDLATGELAEEYAVSLPAGVRIDADRAWIASYETNELLGFTR